MADNRFFVTAPGGGENVKPHQQLVTGADGKAKWEERYGYKKWVETYTESVSFAAGDENSYFDGMTMDNTLGYASSGTFSGDATRLNVVFDGVVYNNLEAGYYGDSNLPYFGNSEASSMTASGVEGTGEPFVIFEGSEGWVVAPSDYSVAHEVVVTALKQEIVPIPAEYVPGPDMIIEYSDGIKIPEYPNNDETKAKFSIVMGNFEDIYAKVSAGEFVNVVLRTCDTYFDPPHPWMHKAFAVWDNTYSDASVGMFFYQPYNQENTEHIVCIRIDASGITQVTRENS